MRVNNNTPRRHPYIDWVGHMNTSEEGGCELNKQVDVIYLKVHSFGLELNLVRPWLDDN